MLLQTSNVFAGVSGENQASFPAAAVNMCQLQAVSHYDSAYVVVIRICVNYRHDGRSEAK